jgi:hypothetical protein
MKPGLPILSMANRASPVSAVVVRSASSLDLRSSRWGCRAGRSDAGTADRAQPRAREAPRRQQRPAAAAVDVLSNLHTRVPGRTRPHVLATRATTPQAIDHADSPLPRKRTVCGHSSGPVNGRSLDGRWNRLARCATDMLAERGHSVHASTATPLRLAHRGACGFWSLLRAGDQCGNALGYGGPQRSGQLVTHAVDHGRSPPILRDGISSAVPIRARSLSLHPLIARHLSFADVPAVVAESSVSGFVLGPARQVQSRSIVSSNPSGWRSMRLMSSASSRPIRTIPFQ